MALVLAALALLAWIYRIEILLLLLEIRQRRALDVGPPQAIEWQSGSDPLGRAAGERPPNIVVILADDLGWNDLTWLGGGVAGGSVPTPHIDSLARDGVFFANGYAANGTCAPSRAALLSGRYGTRFGFEFTPTPAGMSDLLPRISGREDDQRPPMIVAESTPSISFGEMGMPPSEITLAELLAGAGYHSVHIGKWHLGLGDGMTPNEQGFDESLLMASGLYLPEDHPEVVNSRQEFDPIDRFLWAAMNHAASHDGGPAFEPPGYITDYYTDEAVRVIEANRERPFFLYLAHWAVHTPLQALRSDYEALDHIEDHRLRVYAAMVRSLDRSVGRVLAALRENGLEENTLVFFTSDNGAPGYLGLPEVNRPFRGWKITFFEGGIHVPYFLRWPARLPAGAVFEAPVHGFDIFATAAAAAGVPLPDDRTIDGVDLAPHVLGERDGPPHRALFWRTGDYRVVIADGYKLQVSEPPGAVWLFDLASDPTEQHDLSAEQPERVAAMRRLLEAHDAEQAESLWPSALTSPINVDKTLLEPWEAGDDYIYWAN
ncbi:MAG: sulfatase [Acidobacteria bacterium]|nr:MAG: sulfatase [Acidobacteriota bacterium]REK03717.1 MAG: sulfatase [Acidobacteriota bacterium]